jgi:hypothetical protein
MDVALLAFLILLNGVFAMSEMALTASRKARLQVMLEAGEPGAESAMALHDNPTKFLSTVQIGITSIGVLNGIVGEAAFASPLAAATLGSAILPGAVGCVKSRLGTQGGEAAEPAGRLPGACAGSAPGARPARCEHCGPPSLCATPAPLRRLRLGSVAASAVPWVSDSLMPYFSGFGG